MGKRIAALALVLTAGCGKSCKNDHPYVPYAIDEAGSPASADPDAGNAALPMVDAGAFHERAAATAPPDATRWSIDGLDLAAPEGRVFVGGLTSDFDGDGARDAAALVRVVGGTGNEPAEILYFHGSAKGGVDAPSVIAAPPVPLSDPTCSPSQRLGQIGLHSLFVELGASCAGHGPAMPSRWIAVVGVGREASVRLSATVIDPPSAPRLTLDADGADRDGDGLDDVALRVTIEGGGAPFEPGPKVGTVLRWFDRPAGLSRDPDEPDASLRALASAAATRAARAKDAAAVPLLVHQIRALYATICAEGGAPRITNVLGARAVACGSSRGLEEAGLAEVRAHAVGADAVRAIAAFDRAQLPPATRTASRTTDATAWILQAAPVLSATSLRAVAAVPQIERGKAPAWGALAFEPSGKVLVRTVAGVARFDPLSGDEVAAADVAPWRSAVLAPDGAARWIEAYDPCDALALRATFAPTGSGDPRDVALPVAPPLGTRCASSGAKGEPAHALPVAWGPRGLEALVAGEPVLVSPDLARATLAVASLDQPVTPGAPRSPSGRVSVVPTSLGIVVRGARTRIYRARELEGGYLELRDCVVSDDAMRVACVRGGRAFAGVWDAD